MKRPIFNYYPNSNHYDVDFDNKVFRYSVVVPLLFLMTFWLVFLVESALSYNFARFGIFPRHMKGLSGILFSPFIHGSIKHLTANSIPFLLLSTALFYFYRELAVRIFLLIYLLSGLCVWIGAREAWHIGASGLIYGLGAFLFFSGIFRSDLRLLTISLIVVFLYGGMFWGIFPTKPSISWESHLGGAASGLMLSILYRNAGPQRSRFEWEDEEDETQTVERNNEENSEKTRLE